MTVFNHRLANVSLIRKYTSFWGIIPIMLILLIGCDSSFTPLNEDKGRFSIYGYLNLDSQINYIRVKNLNTPFLKDTVREIDAEVTLTNMDKGITETLQDTIVEFDGVKTHNFRTTMDIQSNQKYKVSVKGSDGRRTYATATAPVRAETSVIPQIPNCTTKVNINFEPIRSQFDLRLEIGFEYKSDMFWVPMNDYISHSNGGVIASFTPWRVLEKVFEVGDPPAPDGYYEEGEVFCHQLSSRNYHARYTHYSPDLLQNSISDTLSLPGGTGKFGAFYQNVLRFRIDTTELCPPLSPVQCN